LNSYQRRFVTNPQLGCHKCSAAHDPQPMGQMAKRLWRALHLSAAFALLGLVFMAGCGGDSGGETGGGGGGGGGLSLSGTVQGGLTGVSDATVTLYEAGTAYGAGATSLGTATTDSRGKFKVKYQPLSSPALLYVVAADGNGANSAIGLMDIAGPSNALPESIVINELTTVAAEWALAQFTDSTGTIIGAPSTNATGLTNAANQAQANLADITTGGPAAFWTTYGINAGTCASSPPVNCDGLERMNTFANILAACVESSGRSSSACTTLLSDTAGASTTAEAAHHLATSPGLTANISDLFALQSGSPPYTPALSVAPDGWEIALNLNPSGAEIFSPRFVAIDGSGDAWVSDSEGTSLSELTPTGSLIANYDPTGANFDAPRGFAIDSTGNVWATNFFGNSVTELNSSGGLAGDFNPDGANFTNPTDLAIDQQAMSGSATSARAG
jgi:hypothetical protein